MLQHGGSAGALSLGCQLYIASRASRDVFAAGKPGLGAP
jgi:hypothetical protein